MNGYCCYSARRRPENIGLFAIEQYSKSNALTAGDLTCCNGPPPLGSTGCIKCQNPVLTIIDHGKPTDGGLVELDRPGILLPIAHLQQKADGARRWARRGIRDGSVRFRGRGGRELQAADFGALNGIVIPVRGLVDLALEGEEGSVVGACCEALTFAVVEG